MYHKAIYGPFLNFKIYEMNDENIAETTTGMDCLRSNISLKLHDNLMLSWQS